jgi:hypothetical protein
MTLSPWTLATLTAAAIAIFWVARRAAGCYRRNRAELDAHLRALGEFTPPQEPKP